MFDKKKLEAFLDSLRVETHYPSEAPKKIVEPPRSALDAKMDKYDIFRNGAYEKVGTPEYPIWAKIGMQSILDSVMESYFAPRFMTYGGIQRSSSPWNSPQYVPMAYSPWDDSQKPAPPVETPYDKLKSKIARMGTVAPAKIENPKPVPPPAPRSPDYVGTLTAWRGWGVDAGKLVALGYDHVWEPKEKERAKCREDNTHPAPKLDCSCGFWSFRTLDLLTQALAGYLDEVVVIGTVEIWGRVIECENGFRSEYAYPKELWFLEEEGDLEQLSWTYGVPVRRLRHHAPCTALVPVKKTK